MAIRQLIGFLFLFFLCNEAFAANADSHNYNFNRVEVSSVLSNSEVKCIFKDKTGFIWFGTPSGLNRYDGYEVILYKQDLTNGYASNNNIEKIQEAFDGKLWIKTRSGYNVYDPAMERFVPNVNELFAKYSGTDESWNNTEAIVYIDHGDDFWFVTPNGVRKYDTHRNECITFRQGEADGLSRGVIRDIKQGQNRYWFLFDNGVLECMEAQTNKVISRDSTLHKAAGLKHERGVKMFVDSSGDIWVYGLGVNYGLAMYSIVRNSWQRYSVTLPQPFHISTNIVSSIIEDRKGIIWTGTDHGGINLIDKATGEVIILRNDEHDSHSLLENTVRSLYCDDSGIVWIGTYKKGVCYYHESIYKFNLMPENGAMPFRDINSFCESKDNNLWMGTNGGGLLFYDRSQKTYTEYRHSDANSNTPAGDVIVSLALDPEGKLWIGYYLSGMDCFDGKTFKHYENNSEGLADNNAWVMMCDRSANLWVGTLHSGVFVWDTKTGKRIRSLKTSGTVYGIVETKTGAVLVGAQSGIYIYNNRTDSLELYEEEIFAGIQLSRHDINSLFEDSRGLLWIGTRTGLFVFNPYTKGVHEFSCDSGLTSDLVQSIIEDAGHNIWVAGNSGLTCIYVSTSNTSPGYFFNPVNYDSSEGLQGEMFNYNAAYLTSRSELVFGGSSGYNIFTPSLISYNRNVPHIVVTDFSLYNRRIRPLEPYDGRIVLKQSITATKEINLDYSDNYFSLSFAALDYCMPNKSHYFYKLEGFNNQWLETGRGNRTVTYTNLNPGKYILYLKAVNNDGIESPEPLILRINVRPPLWKTVWAWIFYGLMAAGLGVYLYFRISKRSEQKLANARNNMRISQQLEMDEMKLSFFTNISHEFRTPLTLILSPLENLLNKAKDPDDREMLSIIRRNAQSLLTLVSQLLDFRKLDASVHNLHKSLGDIVLFIKQQTELFAEIMARNEIKFSFHTQVDSLYMYFDADKLSKVLVNILSNAFKFTTAEGSISIELAKEGDEIRITITDSGVGIPEDELDKVFDRFYQVKRDGQTAYQGSGIGLHISKEFVNLHGGKIWAENVEQGGCRFTLTLPIMDEGETATIDEGEELEEEDDRELGNRLPKALIVEDNRELCTLLVSMLKDYSTLQAHDGVEGLEIALKEIPDLILSDVMMPRMDGITMTRKIREDIRTSHIPLILLTAKSGDDNKLEGLTAGADDYITKPFNQELLQIKMRNLLEARRRNQKLFDEQIHIEPSKITVNSLDEQLIKKAIEYTEANMSNPELSVEELSRELGMSRVHLYKKLSSISGKTPIEFIRIIRLKRAAQLLEDSQLTVSEIAYEVGFNNPKYFRKYFKDEFGILPSQYGSRNE